jgi:hypothetical protein
MTTKTHTWYQLTKYYGEYSHTEVVIQSPNYPKVKGEYDSLFKETIAEGDESWTDSLEIEKIIVTLDEDGDVDDVVDYLETIDEHVFKPNPED